MLHLPPNPPWVDHSNNIRWDVQIRNRLITQFCPSVSYSSPLDSILSQISGQNPKDGCMFLRNVGTNLSDYTVSCCFYSEHIESNDYVNEICTVMSVNGHGRGLFEGLNLILVFGGRGWGKRFEPGTSKIQPEAFYRLSHAQYHNLEHHNSLLLDSSNQTIHPNIRYNILVQGPKRLWRHVVHLAGKFTAEKFPRAGRHLRFANFGPHRVLKTGRIN